MPAPDMEDTNTPPDDFFREVADWLEREIVPQYARFDAAHREDHAHSVMERSLRLWDVVKDLPDTEVPAAFSAPEEKGELFRSAVLVVAAYHDLGLSFGRELHHVHSARILMDDARLLRWFSVEQKQVMADACEDHRASAKAAPRTIFGRIVAEADRLIIPEVVVRRTIQFGQTHYPELSREEHYQRMLLHLKEKYGEGGYLKLWVPQSDNAARLQELHLLIRDENRLRALFDQYF